MTNYMTIVPIFELGSLATRTFFVAGGSYGHYAAATAAAGPSSDVALTAEESKQPAYAQKRAEQSKQAEYEQRQSQRVCTPLAR